MSPALNRSSAIRRFEGSNAIEIRDGITFDFYMGLPHMHPALHHNVNMGSVVELAGYICTKGRMR